MIYPRRNGLFKFVLHTYVRWFTARNFHQINFNRVTISADRSVLLLANHFSAWDAFILFWVNRDLLRKNFHVMILEETLNEHPMLKYGGAFSVKKASKDALASLDHAAALLHDPQNLVLIYPQGKLHSNMLNEVVFEKGVMRVLKKAQGKFDMLFAATFVENFENFKPVANVYLETPGPQNFSDIEQLQNAYQQHYAASQQQQIQIIK